MRKEEIIETIEALHVAELDAREHTDEKRKLLRRLLGDHPEDYRPLVHRLARMTEERAGLVYEQAGG